MSNNEKQALETKQEIKESVKRYKDLYKEANGFVDEKYADLLKNAKNDLAKILDVAEKNKVFSVKEIESILNETDTSGIKQYFGLSETNTENGIDKNEKQILELIAEHKKEIEK